MLDLSAEELQSIGERLERALERRPILPLQSLQYRLGEVGRNRVHPYALLRALQGLVRPITSRSTVGRPLQPWAAAPHLYVSPSCSAEEARVLAQNSERSLEQIAQADWKAGFEAFVAAVEQATGPLESVGLLGMDADPVPLTSGIEIPAESRVLRCRRRGASPVHLWISQDVRWIHPNDPRLWVFLKSCVDENALPLVIGRAIDPAAFPVFEALQVQGLQYYGMWSTVGVRESISAIAGDLGWFFLNSAEEAGEHRVFGQLSRALQALSASNHPIRTREAITEAVVLGLTAPGPGATERLLRWSDGPNIGLSEHWRDTLRRWITWSQGGTLRLTSKPRRKTKARIDRSDAPVVKPPSTPPAKELESPEISAEVPWGFGRKTRVTRVPLRLR
jgi:hypothetical protein